jgi:putative ABC transport system permease protein
MLSISLKNLWSHKRRLAGTLLAVVLGVAFLSGTLVLGDTLRANFDSLFSSAIGETDAVVRNATRIVNDQGGPDTQPGLIEESLAERVRAVDGVAAAAPVVEGYGRLIGADGKAIGGNGPPTLAGNWVEDPDLNPFRIAEGRPPRAIDEVVVNRGAARAGDLRVGDTVTVETPSGSRSRSSACRPSAPPTASAAPPSPPSRSRARSGTSPPRRARSPACR